MAATTTLSEHHRAVFRVFIDYVQAFPLEHQHLGLLLWRPDGSRHRGVNYTEWVLESMANQTLQLGVLPDEACNAWTATALHALLQRFETTFDVISRDEKTLETEGEPCSGTAQVVLQHKVCTTQRLTLRFLKKAAVLPHWHVYLIDNEGQSTPVKKCKRISIFTLSFVTNTCVMEPWLDCQRVQRRKRKEYTTEEKEARRVARKQRTPVVLRDDQLPSEEE